MKTKRKSKWLLNNKPVTRDEFILMATGYQGWKLHELDKRMRRLERLYCLPASRVLREYIVKVDSELQ